MRKLIIVSILIIVASIIPILKISATESMQIIGDVSSIRNGTAQIEIQLATTSKQLIIAGYNNKVLKAITTITIESGEGNKLVDIPPFSNDVTTVKFFLWNSLHKISPLISSLTYNLPEISDEYVIRITAEDIESGGYVYGSKSENSKRLRVNRLIPVTKGSVVTFYLNSQQIYIYEVDKAGATTSQKKYGWDTVSGTYTVTYDGYLAIVLADRTNKSNNIATENYDSQISIMQASQSLSTTSTYPEGHRIIKRFGGECNDWSFVYLPDDYYTNTSKKYPFVIANHGNGWKMDGKEENANWTKRTMYVPMSDSDYKTNDKQSRKVEC